MIRANWANDVETWLAQRRTVELTIARSVKLWIVFDKARIARVRAAVAEECSKAAVAAGLRPTALKTVREHQLNMIFHPDIFAEIEADAIKHKRSFSMSVRWAWERARNRIRQYPDAPGVMP